MASNTSIEWTDQTWNPVRGCSRVSEGCRNCYAEKVAHRFSGPGQPYEGLTVLGNSGVRWTGKIRLVPESLKDPLGWKKPRRVFVNSMSDLFHEDIPDEFIEQVFGVMALTPQHTYQILTKRPARAADWFGSKGGLQTRAENVAEAAAHLGGVVWDSRGITPHLYPPHIDTTAGKIANRRAWPGWPLPNVWIGVSAEDQKTADARVPVLLTIPAALRFISHEPALGPINWGKWVGRCDCGLSGSQYTDINGLDYVGQEHRIGCPADRPHVEWVIMGGESGPRARPFDLVWARIARGRSAESGVALFIKQLGAAPKDGDQRIVLKDPKGGNMDEWPANLRVREFPQGAPNG